MLVYGCNYSKKYYIKNVENETCGGINARGIQEMRKL
jgi:hypothetical protein